MPRKSAQVEGWDLPQVDHDVQSELKIIEKLNEMALYINYYVLCEYVDLICIDLP